MPRLGPILLACVLSLSAVALPTRPAGAADGGQTALSVSKQALAAYQAGRFRRAAEMYRTAWHLDSRQLIYLYNAARAAQRAGALESSERDYGLFLQRAPADSPELLKARKHLEEIAAARRVEARRRRAKAARLRSMRVKPPAKKTVGRLPPKPPAPIRDTAAGKRALGWVMVVGGVAAVGGGAYLLLNAWSDQDALSRKYSQRDVTGKIIGISGPAAKTEQDRINRNLMLGWGLGGVGLVGVGVGAYLVASRHAPHAWLLPTPGARGASLLVRF